MAALHTPRPSRWPGGLALLATLAVGLAVFYYFTGESATLPWQLVPTLTPLPLALDSVRVGGALLPLPVNGYAVSLTHSVGGPLTQPLAAGLWVAVLAGCLAGWLAVVSTLRRLVFVGGMVPVVFLLQSLNLDALGVFGEQTQYFLYLTLAVLGGAAFGLHAFAENMALRWRGLLLLALVAGLGALLLAKSNLSVSEAVLQLAAYATPGGAVLVAALVLWVGIENIRALLWFNTQAENPADRFGTWPFVLSSGAYLVALAWRWWNNGVLTLYPGVDLDPLVLLLPAVLAGGLGLPGRAASYGQWVPYRTGARQLYPLLLTAAATALGYAFATANTPLLDAARTFTGLALLTLGAAFLVYVLSNFGPLIQQRLRVYRVVFEPRRLPFYAVYVLGIAGIVLVQLREGWPLLNQVKAGLYVQLGDLTRQQSEARPDDFALAVLAERYYAESGDVLYRSNRRAQLGRAALYRFRQQRQNEINALQRGLQRGPEEKVSALLGQLFPEAPDFLDGLEALREGVRDNPRSAALAGDLAQLFTRSALADSVAFYLDRAEALAPGSYASQTNRLAFLQQQNLPAAAKLAADFKPTDQQPALRSNLRLLALQQRQPENAAAAHYSAPNVLTPATFAEFYHAALGAACRSDSYLLAQLLRRSAQPENAPYEDQLRFLRALTLHNTGRELAARQAIAPLAAGTGSTAGYYQYVLGLWQLQQQQYAAAARQLALAAQNKFAPAVPAQLFARFVLSAPDSAAAYQQALQQVPDSVRRVAAGWVAAARNGKALLQWQKVFAADNPQDIKLLLNKLVKDKSLPLGAGLYAQVVLAHLSKQPAAEARYYAQIVSEAPFDEYAIRNVAEYYRSRRDYTAAYNALRAGLNENPQSLPLARAYVLAATDAGLPDYARAALEDLKSQLPSADYAALAAAVEARRAARADSSFQ